MQGWKRLSLTAASLSALAAPGALSAQATTPSVPTREEVLREELDQRLREGDSALDLDGTFQRAPCPLAAEQFADISLTLTNARFNGTERVEP